MELKTFEELMNVKAGDKFVFEGYSYKAYEDASYMNRFGYESVSFYSGRAHGQMPSGYEACTFIEKRKVQ